MVEAARDLYVMALRAVGQARAKELVRRICRDMGGVEVYLPLELNQSTECKLLRELFADLLGADWEVALERFLALAGCKMYIPKEISVFRREIALEVLALLEGGGRKIDIVRQYKISVSTMYNLRGQALKWRIEDPKLSCSLEKEADKWPKLFE